MQAALKYNSSDIHIHPKKECYDIYFRVNGQLTFYESATIEWAKKLISYLKFRANLEVGERRKPQSGSVRFSLNHDEVELRLSTITNVHMLESLVIRIFWQVEQSEQMMRLYFPHEAERLKRLVRRKSGLVLFSGPVGSGKTSMIYQLLRERMSQEKLQVITMEDPVEIYEESFLQTEINPRAGITYHELIKAALRHHPDVLVIGEIRDEETCRMVIRGALTGHLMIATIHAKNALGVIGRLQELQVTNQQLRQTLIGVISQRLVPQYCPLCQGSCQPSCHHHNNAVKRLALFELLEGDAIQHVLSDTLLSIDRSINQQLNKAWSLGFIDEKAYEQFELV